MKALLAALAVASIWTLAGCADALPRRPDASALDVVGRLLAVNESDTRTQYGLADGTTWARLNDTFRVLYDLPGENTLFVAGHDSQGEYVLLVGDQDGLPPGCAYALRYGGTDWGDAVEGQGVLWRKAVDFTPLEGAEVRPGSAYPSNAALCLNERAEVTSIYLAEPAPGESGQAPSASAAS
jgi:hypothetical protein